MGSNESDSVVQGRPAADIAPDGDSRAASVVVGLAIMGMGVFLLLSRMGVIDVRISGRLLWPFFVLGLGLVRLAAPGYDRGRRRSRGSGVWLVWVGIWGMLTEFHVFGLDFNTSWPLLIVGVGAGMVWRAFETSRETVTGRS